MAPEAARIAVIGIHGHGASHVLNAGRVGRLVAVVDPRPPQPQTPAADDDVRWFTDLDSLLAADLALDVAVLCTPLHTHAAMTTTLLRAGLDVLLEKPPTTTLAEFEALLAVSAETGRLCQVGFQSLGSQALERVDQLVASGAIGTVSHLGAVGTWVRRRAYWQRAAWAGKRSLDGRPVVDGVITNPLAHATATALRLAGARRAVDVTSIDLALFRANDIEADDTSSVRIETEAGPTVIGAFTLCAETERPPSVTVYGSTGSIRLDYTLDRVHWTHDGGTVTTEHERSDLLADLIAARTDGTALLNPLADNGAFMRVMEAVRTAPDPQPIPSAYVRWEGEGLDAHPIVPGIDAALARVADEDVALHRVVKFSTSWSRLRA
ncbi:Gfo/Idh/MocA family protein [Microlunatus ginsengisoli]|uniref:Gfo/Idh/MocA family oxidoreductase n=1 Tax=Microlunatus ginsengisoli TaxID=363863 RepID=A0ABP6ZNQ9_9ACTN